MPEVTQVIEAARLVTKASMDKFADPQSWERELLIDLARALRDFDKAERKEARRTRTTLISREDA